MALNHCKTQRYLLHKVVAAATDGFITRDVASHCLLPGHGVDTGRDMIHLCYVVLQDFATASWFFQSALTR